MEQQVVDTKDEPLVSLIVPVFNTQEDLLRKCVESMRNQTWSNLEIILVDDCSTNEVTLQLLQEYQQKDSRIKVLRSPENSGQAFCRNLGEESCNGEFFSFIDHDDSLANEFVGRSVKIIQDNNTDFVMCNVRNNLSKQYVLSQQDIPYISMQNLLAQVNVLEIPVACHGRLFRTKSYKQAHIKFEGKTRDWEDNLWTWYCLFKLKSLSLLSYEGYHRLMHDESYSRILSLSKATAGLDRIFQMYRFCKHFGYTFRDNIFLVFSAKYCQWVFKSLTPKEERIFILRYMFFTLKRCNLIFELDKNKVEKLITSYKDLIRTKNNISEQSNIKLRIDPKLDAQTSALASNLQIYSMLLAILNEFNLRALPPLDEETYLKHYIELYRPEDWL